MNKRIALACLAVLAGVAVVGCKDEKANAGATEGGTAVAGGRPLPEAAGNTAEGDTIKIGMIASLNGELKPWGEDSRKGAQLAVDEFNEAGGLNGKKVELLVEDSASKAEQGKSATEKLINQDKVVAMVGEVASGITMPAAQVCQETGVPLVAVGATKVEVTQDKGAVFRACFTDNFQGAAMAKFAYEDLGLRNMAIMTDKKQPYSTGLSDIFRQAFTQFGGKIVGEEFYESGNIDFKAQLTNLKSNNPDGLFLSGYFNEVGPIARQTRTVGLNVPLVGGDGWDSKELIQSGGEGILGGYYSNHYSNLEDRPAVQNFVAAFSKKFGSPPATAMGALGYDAMGVVLDSLKRADEMNSRSLLKAISETKDFQGVSGTFSIGPDGNAQKPILVLKVTKEGFVPEKQIPFFVFEPSK